MKVENMSDVFFYLFIYFLFFYVKNKNDYALYQDVTSQVSSYYLAHFASVS